MTYTPRMLLPGWPFDQVREDGPVAIMKDGAVWARSTTMEAARALIEHNRLVKTARWHNGKMIRWEAKSYKESMGSSTIIIIEGDRYHDPAWKLLK